MLWGETRRNHRVLAVGGDTSIRFPHKNERRPGHNRRTRPNKRHVDILHLPRPRAPRRLQRALNDVPQPEGVYVYVIDATFKDGQKEHHHGNVTLLR